MLHVLLFAANPITYCLCQRFWIGQIIAVVLAMLIGARLADPWRWTGAFLGVIVGWILVFILRLMWCGFGGIFQFMDF